MHINFKLHYTLSDILYFSFDGGSVELGKVSILSPRPHDCWHLVCVPTNQWWFCRKLSPITPSLAMAVFRLSFISPFVTYSPWSASGLRQVCVRSSKQSAESRRLPVILCWLIFQMSQVKEFGMGEWELAKRIHSPTTTTQRFSSGRIYPVSLAKGMFHNRQNKMMEQMFVLNCFLTSH